MSKEVIKFKCGHEVEVWVSPYKGETEEHWRERQEGNLCPDCYREFKRQEKVSDAKRWSEKYEFPELSGTDKQIEYAWVTRWEKFFHIEEELYSLKNELDLNGKEVGEFYDWLFWDGKQASKAKFWLDNKNTDINTLYKMYLSRDAHEEEPEPEIKTETLYPENQKTDVVATITADDDEVVVTSDKDYTIIDVVKSIGFKWSNRAWRLPLTLITGKAENRITEVGNKLLNAGVIVTVPSYLKEKVISGEFEPRHERIIMKDNGEAMICWPYGEDFYWEAKKLPGAKKYGGFIHVKPAYYAEIREFAKLYSFYISPGTEKILKAAEEKVTGAQKIQPTEVAEPKAEKPDLTDIMKNNKKDILDDLRDD